MRFLHTSDWQLGMTRAFLTPEASARFSQARIDAIGALGRLAAEHDAKFIVVAGDVFESSQISRETLLRHAGWTRRLARQLVRDEDEADDAVQDAWAIALRSPPRHRANLRGWLAHMLRSAVRSRQREV